MDALTRAREVKQRHDRDLMSTPGVEGVGVSLDDEGNPVIDVFVRTLDPGVRERIPAELEGVPVRVVETGRFEAR